MKCPKCNKEIDKVRVYRECWQWGFLYGSIHTDSGGVNAYGKIYGMECPECGQDIQKFIEQSLTEVKLCVG